MTRAARLAVLLAALTATRAGAEELKLFDTAAPRRSPQHFAFELKFGAYSPDIDSSPGLGGNHPFSDLFISQLSPDVGKRPPGRSRSRQKRGMAMQHTVHYRFR